MTFGVPFSETDTVFFGAGLERTDARRPTRPARLLYQNFVTQNGGPANGIGTGQSWRSR